MATSRAVARRGRWGPAVFLQAGIVTLWMAAFLLARLLEHSPHASLWFPPAAVTFSTLLVVGVRALPAILVACTLATFVAELQYSSSVRPAVLAASSVAFAVTHGLAYGVPALLLRRQPERAPADVTLRSVARFILLGMMGAALAAVCGVLALTATGLIQADAPGRLMAAWWMGDFVALLTFAPLFIRWAIRAMAAAGLRGAVGFSPFIIDPTPAAPSAWLKLGAMAAVTVLLLVLAHGLQERALLLALLVVPLVLQLWVVHSESRTAALHGVVIFSLITVGAGALFNVATDVVALQFAAIGLAVNTYFGLAVPALYSTNERLREQVTRDRLTGVMTRAYFEDRAGHELERARVRGDYVGVILFDLDGLKSINDTHGHAVGDAVLAHLATRCASAVRPGDLIGRLGGDEFAVFLPDADVVVAERVVARMRKALQSAPLAGPVAQVCASFGWAVGRAQDSGIAGLLREADKMMYERKRQLRHRPVDSV